MTTLDLEELKRAASEACLARPAKLLETDPFDVAALFAENDRLRSELEAERERNEWRPIESAPKDGTRILCWNKEWQAPESGCLYGMMWAANSLAADKGGWKYQPTHWRPLPEPPARAHFQSQEAIDGE